METFLALMGAAPCRADSRNRETKKAQAISFQLFTIKIKLLIKFVNKILKIILIL